MKTPPGAWGQHQIASLLGTSGPAFGRLINGLDYPTLHMMQKFEVVFEWPVVEQVQLVPYLWHEHDLRYSMVLRQHIDDWAEQHPRTMLSGEVRMHPGLAHRTSTRHRRGPRG